MAPIEDHEHEHGAVGYEPPRILWEEPFEPLNCALSCAKDPDEGGGAQCTSIPKV